MHLAAPCRWVPLTFTLGVTQSRGKMNRAERMILGPSIKAICRHDKHLWWELKYRIFSDGSQAYYPRQSEYEFPVRRAIQRLDSAALKALEAEWRKANPGDEPSSDALRRYYEAVIIEEIVRRAGIAAYRTNEW